MEHRSLTNHPLNQTASHPPPYPQRHVLISRIDQEVAPTFAFWSPVEEAPHQLGFSSRVSGFPWAFKPKSSQRWQVSSNPKAWIYLRAFQFLLKDKNLGNAKHRFFDMVLPQFYLGKSVFSPKFYHVLPRNHGHFPRFSSSFLPSLAPAWRLGSENSGRPAEASHRQKTSAVLSLFRGSGVVLEGQEMSFWVIVLGSFGSFWKGFGTALKLLLHWVLMFFTGLWAVLLVLWRFQSCFWCCLVAL